MSNPPRTQQNSIFEPLFSPEEELHTDPPTHRIHSSSSEWLSSTYSAASPCFDKAFSNNNQLRKTAPATIFLKEEEMMTINQTNVNERNCGGPASRCAARNKEPIMYCDDSKPSSTSHASSTYPLPTRSSMQSTAPPSRSLSLPNVVDDGSVASKLLASITKSISSPSLLSCCKESVRETSYQKTLKLRMMKLQHCAEELGSESSDDTSVYNDGGDNSSFDSVSTMSLFDTSPQSSILSSFASRTSSPSPSIPAHEDPIRREGDASPVMISVRSAPNLRCSSLVSSRHSSSHMRERSFPPPLTHTLPRSASASSASFTFSLRAHREEGRFMLKEVKVPCSQYLQANRKDGRLTLQLFTSDEGKEQEESTHKEFEDVVDVRQGENVVDMCEEEGARSVAPMHKHAAVGCSYDDKLGVEESANTVVGGGLLEVMKSKEKDVGSMGLVSDMRKDGAKSLLVATINVRYGSEADDVSAFDALCTRRPDLNGAKCKPERPRSATSTSLPSSWNLNTPAPKNNPRLNLSPVTSQWEENLVLQSRMNGKHSDREVKSMMGLEISSASLQGAGFGLDRSLSSTIIFKDVGANSLMENVTNLVNSFGLDGGKWCQENILKSREVERSGFKDGQSSMYSGIRSINIGVRKVERNIKGQKASGVRILDVECGRELRQTDAFEEEGVDWININAGGLSTKATTRRLDGQLNSLQYDWLHSLHCKERFGRNHQFGNKLAGFPCVAIRS